MVVPILGLWERSRTSDSPGLPRCGLVAVSGASRAGMEPFPISARSRLLRLTGSGHPSQHAQHDGGQTVGVEEGAMPRCRARGRGPWCVWRRPRSCRLRGHRIVEFRGPAIERCRGEQQLRRRRCLHRNDLRSRRFDVRTGGVLHGFLEHRAERRVSRAGRLAASDRSRRAGGRFRTGRLVPKLRVLRRRSLRRRSSQPGRDV